MSNVHNYISTWECGLRFSLYFKSVSLIKKTLTYKGKQDHQQKDKGTDAWNQYQEQKSEELGRSQFLRATIPHIILICS